MLGWIKSVLQMPEGGTAQRASGEDRVMAAAALMVEIASSDGAFSATERRAIEDILVRRFALPPGEAGPLVDEVIALHARSTDLHRFVSALNRRFTPEERLSVAEMLWEVAYADGEAQNYESGLMRRLAGLLYLEDADVGAARRRVRARLGLEG